VAYANIDPFALDALLDSADAMAAELRETADDAQEFGSAARAAELRILADRYDVARRAIEDPEGV